jgi:hypothetical protein
MTDDPNATSREIIRSAKRDIAEADLGLVSRALNEADEIKVTAQQIADARANNPSFANLSNMAIKIALEQKANWENSLFFQIISDEVLAADDLFNAVILRKATTSGNYMDSHQTLNAYLAKIAEVQVFVQRHRTLLYELKVAWSSSEPGKLESIITASRNYGLLYPDALNWSLDVLSWNVHEAFYNFLLLLSDTILPFAMKLAFAGPQGLSMIGNNALAVESPTTLNLNLVFDAPPLDHLYSTFQQAARDAQQ